MLYVMETYWKAVAADYEESRAGLGYTLDACYRSLAQDAKALIQR